MIWENKPDMQRHLPCLLKNNKLLRGHCGLQAGLQALLYWQNSNHYRNIITCYALKGILRRQIQFIDRCRGNDTLRIDGAPVRALHDGFLERRF
jgi:hypothetical protein